MNSRLNKNKKSYAGIVLYNRIGDYIKKGDVLCEIFINYDFTLNEWLKIEKIIREEIDKLLKNVE